MTDHRAIHALGAGVGGAKLASGLIDAVNPNVLIVVVNVGDDFKHLRLAISPDVDSIIYSVSGRSDDERSWGRISKTLNFMSALKELSDGDTCFNIGDRDFAVHVQRTARMNKGVALSAVTAEFAKAFGSGCGSFWLRKIVFAS